MSNFGPANENITISVNPLTKKLIERQKGTVFLIANNPLIDLSLVRKLEISENDILVQFNRAPLFDLFSHTLCHKVHVFNAGNGPSGYWGFDHNGMPERDYYKQDAVSISMYFTGWLSEVAKEILSNLPEKTYGALIYPVWQPAHFKYPESLFPSVGFQATVHFRVINSLRIWLDRPPLKLTLIGFSGVYPPGTAWPKHDFAFEQACYATWLDITSVNS